MAGQVNNVYKLFVEVDALVSELCVDHLPYAANGLIRRLEVVAILEPASKLLINASHNAFQVWTLNGRFHLCVLLWQIKLKLDFHF